MKSPFSSLPGVCLLTTLTLAASAPQLRHGADSSFPFHKHSDDDLDVVQCHHSEYRINQENGRPELVNPAESRVDPSRQYLPAAPPADPPVDPAASFDQPNYLTVEKTLVSPSLQNNYKSLFGENNKPDSLSPSAAQNAPTNILVPDQPRKVGNKHHHDDDENNLERLCNDAFHSFLCKPIKGPRKTPTGRLRPNAVIPPDVLAGLSSFQDVTRVKPDKPEIPSPSNNVGFFVKPTTKTPSVYTTTVPTTENLYKYSKPINIPSPTNNNPQVLQPRPSNTYLFDKPKVPFPSNNVPRIAQPPQDPPKHDCDQHKSEDPNELPNPSNNNPYFISPSPPKPTTPKTFFNNYNVKPSYPLPSNNIPKFTQPPPKQVPNHDCEKHSQHVVPSPSNNSPFLLKPYSTSTLKPFAYNYYSKPSTALPTNSFPKFAAPTYKPTTTHDCEKNKSPFTFKSYTTTYKPPTDIPQVPLPSNNVAQVAQPQTVNAVSVAPRGGYIYEKPAIPFPPPIGNPSNQNQNFIQTTQKPFQTSPPYTNNGYHYDQPKVPFASNNIAQIISQPTTERKAVFQTTPTPSPTSVVPCEHHNVPHQNNPEESNPTNDNIVILKPSSTSNGYVYDKPNQNFNEGGSSIQNQFVSTTVKPSSGYSYPKPKTPFLLPNPSNTVQNVVPSSTAHGFSYQRPQPQPSRIPNETNFDGNAQTQVDVTVRPGYAYDKPSKPFISPQPTNQNQVAAGYSYPKPSVPFAR